MQSNVRALILGSCLVVAMGAPVQAATLTPYGIVLINRGSGFERITGPINCRPTDQVMVSAGSAHIEHHNGSKISLQPGRLYTVCDPDGRIPHDHRDAHGLQGSHGASAGPHGTAAGASAGVSEIATTAVLLIGGAIAAHGIRAVADKLSKPASP